MPENSHSRRDEFQTVAASVFPFAQEDCVTESPETISDTRISPFGHVDC